MKQGAQNEGAFMRVRLSTVNLTVPFAANQQRTRAIPPNKTTRKDVHLAKRQKQAPYTITFHVGEEQSTLRFQEPATHLRSFHNTCERSEFQ